ncbi:MAG: hypothetical protein Q8O67_30480 [Deltaproteobacteria bacterium]|nr:hypothetical protein [Deltaproteobacteria bacterium]
MFVRLAGALVVVVVVVVVAGCKPDPVEACGGFVKTFDAAKPTAESLAVGRALLQQHGSSSVRECDDVKLLLEAAQAKTDRLDALAAQEAAGLGRGGIVDPTLQGSLLTCLGTCRAPIVGTFACMQSCGCVRTGVELVAETQTLRGNYTCAPGAQACGDLCNSVEADLARTAAAAACTKSCHVASAIALGDAERAAELQVQQSCCTTVKGTWAEGACTPPQPVWFAVCKKTNGARAQPTPQDCCGECGGTVTGTGCNTSRESDKCFVKCLKTIPR